MIIFQIMAHLKIKNIQLNQIINETLKIQSKFHKQLYQKTIDQKFIMMQDRILLNRFQKQKLKLLNFQIKV